MNDGLSRDQFRKAFDKALAKHDKELRGRWALELREALRVWISSRDGEEQSAVSFVDSLEAS